MFNDVRQTETHTAEPLALEPSAFEFDMAIEKLKRHRSPGIDQILSVLIKAGSSQFGLRSIKLLLTWNKEELREDWKESIFYLFIRSAINQIVAIIVAYHFCQLHTKFIQHLTDNFDVRHPRCVSNKSNVKCIQYDVKHNLVLNALYI